MTAGTLVSAGFSATLYEQILEIGETVEYYEDSGDNRNLSNYFTTAMQRSIQFFHRYVKGLTG